MNFQKNKNFEILFLRDEKKNNNNVEWICLVFQFEMAIAKNEADEKR